MQATLDKGSVRFITFGCKANQYDTQVLREALLRRGWNEAQKESDLVVINTCTVTAEAGRKARQVARRLARENPEVRIAFTGCLAESEPELLRELPAVHWVLGNGEAKRPVNFLRELGEELDPEELGIPAGITEFAGHTRAFLKIQDGCNMSCAFCIIPQVRGPSRSRPIAELCAEVTRLVQAGHREVVLCGIHIGHWGLDLGLELGQLLEALASLEIADDEGALDWRLRLSSIEATEVTGGVLEAMARHPRRITPHLHMPMQSGDDGVLRKMNRWYSVEEYLRCCELIRAALPAPAFTADILVGFPGEDERAFTHTLEAAREAGFCRIHAFPFSPRPGTRAGRPAEVGTPVPVEEIRSRRARLSEEAHALGERFKRGLSGQRDTVCLEGRAGLSGRYQRVEVREAPARLQGRLVDVALELESEEVEGEVRTRLIGLLEGEPR